FDAGSCARRPQRGYVERPGTTANRSTGKSGVSANQNFERFARRNTALSTQTNISGNGQTQWAARRCCAQIHGYQDGNGNECESCERKFDACAGCNTIGKNVAIPSLPAEP